MIERFRASGLSHLTAVSGQNVAFVLAACGPLLVRLRPLPRWALTVAVIAWFVVLTRFEPSILRAGVMAGLSATAYATGRERSPVRILALAVIGLVLVDPLLAWSIGFWLSVGATAGVCTVGPWLAQRLGDRSGRSRCHSASRSERSSAWSIPSVLVFGRLPLVSVVANLLAVPVAGFVMLYGLAGRARRRFDSARWRRSRCCRRGSVPDGSTPSLGSAPASNRTRRGRGCGWAVVVAWCWPSACLVCRRRAGTR